MTSAIRTESLINCSRRAFVVLLVAFLWLGATCLAIAFFPDALLARWPMRAPWVFPVAIILSWMVLNMTLRGRHWDPHRAETEAVMNDEFRRSNMLQAQRAAFIAVLLLQVPLALAVVHLPVKRALVAMAGSTITLGVSALISAFLYLDRE